MSDIAPTLHRFAGRCPPGGLISLGAARREIVAPTAAHIMGLPALRVVLISFGIALLAACGSNAPMPDWQINTHGALQSFTTAYLTGNSRVADLEFARARREVAATGRPDLAARAEATRCAVRVASLEIDDCAGMAAPGVDDGPVEAAYVDYLRGRWQTLDSRRIALLPQQHRQFVGLRDDGARLAMLASVPDPLARLIAAGVLLQQGLLPPAGVDLAVNAASEQGWRRPLLAWLGVQLKRAEAGSDLEARARIQRRIDLARTGAPGGQ